MATRLRLFGTSVIEASSLPRTTNRTTSSVLPWTAQAATRSFYTSTHQHSRPSRHLPLPTSTNRVSSHHSISRVPSTSPIVGLAQRIRKASTSSTSTTGATASSKSVVKSEASSIEDDVDGQGDKKKEKIKIGEVKRLMVLAKPERKTIGIAIGLVSTLYFFVSLNF